MREPRSRSSRPRALLSGQAGIAVVIDGVSCSCRRVGQPEYQPCRLEDVAYLFGGASDLVSLAGDSLTRVDRFLESEWAHDRAMHLTLILLDRDSHLRAKRIASEVLDPFLSISATRQFVLHRLYTHPLPESADVSEALRLCAEASARTTWGVLAAVRNDQPRIQEVRSRWELLDLQLFGTAPEKAAFERAAAEEGIFFALASNPRNLTEKTISQWNNNPRLKRYRFRSRILDAWAGWFAPERKPATTESQLSLFDDLDSAEL